jgi:hypothetical protein
MKTSPEWQSETPPVATDARRPLAKRAARTPILRIARPTLHLRAGAQGVSLRICHEAPHSSPVAQIYVAKQPKDLF